MLTLSAINNEQILKGISDALEEKNHPVKLIKNAEQQLEKAFETAGLTPSPDGPLYQGRSFNDLTEQEWIDAKKSIEKLLQQTDLQENFYYASYGLAHNTIKSTTNMNALPNIQKAGLFFEPKVIIKATIDSMSGQNPLLSVEDMKKYSESLKTRNQQN